MLESLNKVKVANPVDIIISQIRELIISGQVLPGDKLPPERKLAEHLGVSRGQVREAINKLEFYGILKVIPQSGTVVTGMGVVALEGLITDILKIENPGFRSLVETRILLEMEATKLAAVRRTEEDIAQIQISLTAYEKKITGGKSAIEEDLMYHLKIAEASKNAVLKTLMMIITPDIVKNFRNLNVCGKEKNMKTLQEHKDIFNAIVDGKPEIAAAVMKIHLEDVKEFSLKYKT